MIEDLLQVGRNKSVSTNLNTISRSVEESVDSNNQILPTTTLTTADASGGPAPTDSRKLETSSEAPSSLVVKQEQVEKENGVSAVECRDQHEDSELMDEDVPLKIEEKPQSPYSNKPSPQLG